MADGFVLIDDYTDKADPANLPGNVKITRVTENLKEKLKKHWLEVFEQVGLIDESCQAIGVSTGTVLSWRREDPGFAAAFDEVRRFKMIHLLEDAAFRRALSGKSDLMLIAMLKNLKPDVYDEKAREKPAPPGIQISVVDVDGKMLARANSGSKVDTIDVIDVEKK